MAGPPPLPLVISASVRDALVGVTRSRGQPHAHVVRARMLMLAAEGLATAEVARRTGQSDRSVRKWKERFSKCPRIETLRDAPRCGRPAKVGLETRVAAIRVACERPDDGKRPARFRDLWTQQSLADEVARQTGVTISRSEVGRILRFHGLRPHFVRQWLTSTDKDFDAKAARICSLYTSAPSDEVVLCVDEKPIQVLSRRFTSTVGRDGSIRREFEYVRGGTRTLLAAFDIRTGRVIADLVPHRTAEALTAFLQHVADSFPDKVIHVVWDNLNTHADGKARRWTRFNQRNGGRFRFVRTPIHASWLNQVEIWFSILHRRVIKYCDFPDADVLADRVLGFVGQWNSHEAHPFRWTWRSDAPQNRRRTPPPRLDRKHAKARC